jgi:hypothetical protein
MSAGPFATLTPDGPPRTLSTKGKTKGTAGGRWAMFNGFIDGIAGTLTPAAALTWLVLFRDTKRNGLARTGQADIGRRIGITPRGVRKALAELRAAGLLAVVHRGGIGRGPSAYRVMLSAPTNRNSRSAYERNSGSGYKRN